MATTPSPPRHARRRSSLTGLITLPTTTTTGTTSSPQGSPLSRRLSLVGLTLSFSSSTLLGSSNERTSPTSSHQLASPAGPLSPSNSTGESTPRGLSEIFSNVFKRDRQAVWWGVSETDDIRKLDALLADREIRNEIVMDLLAAHSDFVLPMRFIAAFGEYRSTPDKKERQMKGRKILSTFFQTGSAFHLRSIPDEDLSQVRVEHFGLVKTYLLSEMIKLPLIADYVARLSPNSSQLALEDSTSEGSL